MNSDSIKIIQDVDLALVVMQSAALWLQEKVNEHSLWWDPQNMNRQFMLKNAEPNEFYVALVDEKPAASVILQDNERNQSWKSVDNDDPKSALYIHWLCVHRDFAGANLSKEMIDFAYDQAKSRNFKLLRLDTNFEEMKLRALYERLDFKLVGTLEENHHKTAFYQKTIK